MAFRALAAGAALTLIALPAWADCAADADALDAQVVAAETGASAPGGDIPATPHQQEVLSGETQGSQATGEAPPLETGAGVTGDVDAASPHQSQATRETDDDAAGTDASALIAEARSMGAAGDEAGCQAKLGEAKTMLGME
ncbi:MAG: hypothetical protein ACM35H_09535 [Bacteroidota bacterium]|nr:hypothetical protein [Kiloniellaceae bacterium]